MATLPITKMTLYKHGVGFFERRANLYGEEVKLSFRVEEMNDILKSLTVIDLGKGKVLGVDYTTPQSQEERLAGCSIRLGDARSLRDLLIGLRGRHVQLVLDKDELHTGTLLGIDEPSDERPMASSLVSLLLDDTDQVRMVNLGRVRGVVILDEQGTSDLRFFLATALGQEDYRQVTIRLTPGEHDLAVSYIAPAPTWRVSYRLVLDPGAKEGPRALLQGWGIFDNRLEEDLSGISLALVAGMPISFVYDLYTPFTPERPEVKEERRVAAAPVEFTGAVPEAPPAAPAPGAGVGLGAMAAFASADKFKMQEMGMSREALAQAAPAAATGKELGELFQYRITTPVTVGRGQSAMVPIVSVDLGYRKDLLYNGAKLPTHPVATLRLKNESGLTLERGPVTVLQMGEYMGEAILPFTAAEGELVVPYAVELGVKVREESGTATEHYRLQFRGAYLHFESWDIRWREYQLNNSTAQAIDVLIEHPRSQYTVFDTPEPAEQTDEYLRFAVQAPAQGEVKLKVQERRRTSHAVELQRMSYEALQKHLDQGLIERDAHDRAVEILRLWEQVAGSEKVLTQVDAERKKVYEAQQQIQGNMQALSATGKEGEMRASYVEKLGATEAQLQELAQRESDLKAEIEQLKQTCDERIEALG